MSDAPTPSPADDPDGAGAPADAAGTSRAAGVVPVDLRDYVDFSPDRATRVRVLRTDALALDLWCLEPQQATPVLHLADADVTYTVVGGRSWFVTDDGEVGLDPMGALLVPAGVVHGIDNRAPDPLIVVAAVSPPGSDPATAPTATDRAAVRSEDDHAGPLARVWRRVLGP